MSAVSGLTAKGEKGKSKYVALDINSLYKGKSLENPKSTVLPKHGLQSLGKVGAGRRMPPPANLPSLKSENSGNNPNISLVPSGGQGWGTSTKEKGKAEETSATQQQSQLPSSTSASQGLSSQKTPTTSSSTGPSKTWSSVTSNQEDGGPERSFLGHQSPFFPQEFPKLAGGDVQTEGNRKSSADSQYGPGPSLRPQTEGSWGRGTLQQQQQQQQQQPQPPSQQQQPPPPVSPQQPPPSQSPQPTSQVQPGISGGGLPLNNGSGVNGQQNISETQVHGREQKTYPTTSRGGPLPSSTLGTSSTITSGSGSVGQGIGSTSGHGMTAQLGPGSGLHPQLPQFRGMMPPYMYGRNFPGNYPNYSGMPPNRQPYPYPENRIRNSMRPLAEEEAYQRPAAIITDKDLKGFDEILQNDTQDGWASVHGEIDYNAKLVFSDEEDTPTTHKKNNRNTEEKNRLRESRGYEKIENEKERDHDREERSRDPDWGREECLNEKVRERDLEWESDRRDLFDRDDRWKNWLQQPQGRPGPPLGIDIQRQWQSQQQPRVPFDYRGPPPRPQGGPYASHSRIGPVPPPPQSQQHMGYPPPPPPPPPPPRQSRPSRPSLNDEDELWRQRRRQHSDEMTLAVERARQRREEEEKRYEQSKQTVQEKSKSYTEGNDKSKDITDNEAEDRSQHSNESREEKSSARDRERNERDRLQSNSYQGFSFSRQFQKNVPPRFQKQAELLRQQQHQQPSQTQQFMRQQSSPSGQGPPPSLPLGVNYSPHWGNMPPPPYMNQLTGMPVPPKTLSSGRSDSQGSGTDSYDSDGRAPDQNMQYERDSHYWGRERRQTNNLPVSYDGWRPVPSSGYYEKNVEFGRNCEQRSEFKRNSDKDDTNFVDTDLQDCERRNRELDGQDFNFRDEREIMYDDQVENNEIAKDTDSWISLRDYDDRMPDPFDEPNEVHSSQDKWERERPTRPDSRDSRTSKESIREERLAAEKQGSQSSLSDKESKMSKDEKSKEKTSTIEWGDTPYPAETKRHEWHHHNHHHHHHHPPPITQKQLESVGPAKKNFTPLRRAVPSTCCNSNSSEKKADTRESAIESGIQNIQSDANVNNKDKAEEKIKTVSESDKPEKSDKDKSDNCIIEDKCKLNIQKTEVKETLQNVNEPDKKIASSSGHYSEKVEKDTRNYVQDKTENLSLKKRDDNSLRDKRQSGRDRGMGRSRGGGRGESSRGRGRNGGYAGGFGGLSREYRRSRVDRGPRFGKQRDTELEKDKDKEKDKLPSDESSASEMEDNKLDHVRQKDDDSEVSVDDTSASTTEIQIEKCQLKDNKTRKEDNVSFVSSNMMKDTELEKTEKKEGNKNYVLKKQDVKLENEKLKEEKGGFAPRGEPSRRGRGGSVSIRNSRGGPRYGPSRYGPPPSRAAFGSGRSAKIEEICTEDCNKDDEGKEIKQDDVNNMMTNKSNKSRSSERLPPRRARESLPPRFQKKQTKKYETSDPSSKNRSHCGRGTSGYPGGNISVNKGQPLKENLSDVANEEWETASESSDVAERRERKDMKEDHVFHDKKESRDTRNAYVKKSFSSQRPINDTNTRRTGFDSRRGRIVGDNRQRDNFGRDTRRESGRGRSTIGGDKRSFSGNNTSNSGTGNPRCTSGSGGSGSHGNKNTGRNNGRGNQPLSRNSFTQKNEGSTAVFRVDEIRRDPRGIQAALTDLANRNMKPCDVTPSSKPAKPEKEKSNALEGYDLNNYASVVIIDDQPEVTVDDSSFLCDADDGFQEVTSKKRHKAMVENDVKKVKKESRSRNKSGSRLRQNRLPPRLAKQRESNQFHSKPGLPPGDNNNIWDSEIVSNNKHPVQFPLKDAAPAPPPPVNAWQKPITHTLRAHSPNVGQNAISDSISTNNVTCNTITSSGTTVITEIQALTVSSKSSSFDRSDQHDSGIDVSDQPTSAASSQRSSPSNDCKILGPKNALTTVSVSSSECCTELVNKIETTKPMSTVVFGSKNFKTEKVVLEKLTADSKNLKEVAVPANTTLNAVGSELCKTTETLELEENKAIQLPVTFSTKPFEKGEEGSDMKLDFTFDSELAQLTEQKVTTTSTISHTMQVTNGTSAVGVQSPISPSADELNLKIASVKKVWENAPPMPTVLEHPSGNNTGAEEVPHADNSFGSFAGNADHNTSSLINGNVDNNGANRKDSSNMDSSEVSFRTSPSIQQTGSNSLPVSLVQKGVMNMESSICKVKPQVPSHQNQIIGCTGPVSPPPISLDTTIGIRTLAGLANSVQVAGIPAVPSPPTVLFNSSQQIAPYQHLQMDSSQVLTQQSRAVAAAAAAAMAQFSQTPHGYAAPLGTYGLSHQPASAQLSNAFGQQSMFMQTPPTAHQAQDLYPSNQYRVQPPYAQGQHVTSMSSNQVLNVNPQQNMPTSHLLGSQLVQTRPTPGPTPNPAGPPTPHLQSLHGIQTVQPPPATSYYSTTAQGQNATNFYPQPTQLTASGSPMQQQQQQTQFASQQGFSSQSTLNVLTPATPATQNFRNFGGHQFKNPGAVMSSITGVSDALRSSSHSPTMDSNVCSRGGMFAVGNTTTTTVNSGSVMTVPQISSTGMNNKLGQQQQTVSCTSSGNVRLTNSQRISQSSTVTGNKGTHGLTQSPQQYYSFNQQKYSHVQAAPGVRPILFQGVVRNTPHQAQYGSTTNTMHYPSPIQRPGHNVSQQQVVQQSQRNVTRTQISGSKVTAQLTSAQQAKLRAEAVQQTHMFFNQTSSGKSKLEGNSLDKNRASNTSGAGLEETKGLKPNDMPATSTLSQAEVDTKKAIENKDSKLEE